MAGQQRKINQTQHHGREAAKHRPQTALTISPHSIHLFTRPTAAQHSMTSVAMSRMPHAHAIQSLREQKQISSAAIDEVLILLLRPSLPADTTLLLCNYSHLMTRTDMPRHQRRIKAVIDTHTTTLIPLFDIVHWFLAAVNSHKNIHLL